ncbi:zf-HC2 domain-containing protein [Streptomyces sp. JJ36]|uniref:zf-HC2 domain-containing protein n=1 Tax=Streptomyces sp. JJ36 TaxID=2736645 RepID=UPI001F482CF3|nr:zf-HC2 domain-containing protein [Streptomyces sp. JJ36]MCF6525079.1 zf-HC2 domain-containing protein [Streptomyces sp. JJ36]
MTSPSLPEGQDRHTDVGAYALGLLSDAEASRFEEHLAECGWCGAELESLLGVGAVLDEVAQDPVYDPTARPDPALLPRLLAQVAARRRQSRRRRVLSVVAAAVLVAGGTAVPLVMWQDENSTPAQAVRTAFERGEKFSDTDPATPADATVAVESRAWGTHVTLRLGNLRGPRACDLIAVGEDGERLTVSSWSVPPYGYGIEGTRWSEPLFIQGGAALPPERIDRFEVRDLDGERLATIPL